MATPLINTLLTSSPPDSIEGQDGKISYQTVTSSKEYA